MLGSDSEYQTSYSVTSEMCQYSETPVLTNGEVKDDLEQENLNDSQVCNSLCSRFCHLLYEFVCLFLYAFYVVIAMTLTITLRRFFLDILPELAMLFWSFLELLWLVLSLTNSVLEWVCRMKTLQKEQNEELNKEVTSFFSHFLFVVSCEIAH